MVKLFVGQIPKTMEEDGIRPIMEEYGVVKEIKIIRDKLTNAHRGM
jgi:CUG-BP- and ETR3-like factor